MTMNRRDALKSVVLMMGGTMVGATAILTGCAPEHQIEGLNFTPEDIAFLDEIGESIIPATDTPGAKAAGIGAFMVMMVKDTYDATQQKVFVDGLNALRKDFKKATGKEFMEATLDERSAHLTEMYKTYRASESNDPAMINMVKDLTVLGYFTSEIGATQALRFVEVPGKFEPCIDYKKGDKAFATS